MNRSLWLLALCQGLFLTDNVTFIAINGLVGSVRMAPYGWMATLPVMGYVVGGAFGDPLGGRYAGGASGGGPLPDRAGGGSGIRAGRRVGRGCPSVLGPGRRNRRSRLLQRQRPALSFCSGRNWHCLPFREKAVSLVLAGGLIGAIAGPNLAARTRTLMAGAVHGCLPGAGRRGAAGAWC